MHKAVFADLAKCIGCGLCELVCSGSKDKAFSPSTSLIRVVRLAPVIDSAMICRLCEKPTCVRVCPRKALKQDMQTGVILVDERACTGCGWCVEVCEFGAMILHSIRKVAVTCDLCRGDPLCVQFCPTKALELTTLDVITDRSRKSAVRDLVCK